MEKSELNQEVIQQLLKDKERLDFIQEHKVEIILERDTGEFQFCRHPDGIIIDLVYDTSIRDGLDRMIEYFKKHEFPGDVFMNEYNNVEK